MKETASNFRSKAAAIGAIIGAYLGIGLILSVMGKLTQLSTDFREVLKIIVNPYELEVICLKAGYFLVITGIVPAVALSLGIVFYVLTYNQVKTGNEVEITYCPSCRRKINRYGYRSKNHRINSGKIINMDSYSERRKK